MGKPGSLHMMTPEQAYKNALKQQNFLPDPVQKEAVQLTQQLYQCLCDQFPSTQKFNKHPPSGLNSWVNSLLLKGRNIKEKISTQIFPQLFAQNPLQIKGLYFWGGVGRGKTWLIDSFFNTLPFSNKRRIHFHAFMQDIHEQLKTLPKTPDPLPILGKQIAQEFQLLCIDEFHVQDITDAMLLSGLLKALFAHGVVLVVTSNIPPDELYKNGLQRESFLPAIHLIKQHMQVFELNSKTDYRTLVLEKEGCYHSPLNPYNKNIMEQHFIMLSNHATIHRQIIEINKRSIQVLGINHTSAKHPHSVIWFNFDELCNTARSSADYLYIAKQYTQILISNVYSMGEEKDDIAKRFVHLIDALYDNHCSLVICAETEPDELYHGRRLKISFPRTASRLKEMRSKLYRVKQLSEHN